MEENDTLSPWAIDWDRLEPREMENLCRELLVQMGFQKVEWTEGLREIDLVAELPKKDPDGVEYREVWLISLGRHMPGSETVDRLLKDPDHLLFRFVYSTRGGGSSIGRFKPSSGSPVTVLFIVPTLLSQATRNEIFFNIDRRHENLPTSNLRLRVWDLSDLTALVQSFPQIGYKYFSDDARAQSKYRKTPEELYQENVALAERQTKLIADLQEEKNKRVRAERDAVWKDVSFSAAHKLGNPIFTIETYLDPLERRIHENRTAEAVEVAQKIRGSVEKAKSIIDQFKSLTRAQEINPHPVVLGPLLEDACGRARNEGISCEVEYPADLEVQGDPQRLAECFDELVGNAIQWLDKPKKRIHVEASPTEPTSIPDGLDSSWPYILVRFEDNGSGVAVSDKTRIFDAFFTHHPHGTGLGLALVRRIVEGHGGLIFERGIPGEGALFEIYLPAAQAAGNRRRRRARKK